MRLNSLDEHEKIQFMLNKIKKGTWKVNKFSKGHTNKVALVTLVNTTQENSNLNKNENKEISYILKIFSDEGIIDRNKERLALIHFSQQNLAPKIILSFDNGMVTSFYSGKEIEDSMMWNFSNEIAFNLKKFHSVPFKNISYYSNALNEIEIYSNNTNVENVDSIYGNTLNRNEINLNNEKYIESNKNQDFKNDNKKQFRKNENCIMNDKNLYFDKDFEFNRNKFEDNKNNNNSLDPNKFIDNKNNNNSLDPNKFIDDNNNKILQPDSKNEFNDNNKILQPDSKNKLNDNNKILQPDSKNKLFDNNKILEFDSKNKFNDNNEILQADSKNKFNDNNKILQRDSKNKLFDNNKILQPDSKNKLFDNNKILEFDSSPCLTNVLNKWMKMAEKKHSKIIKEYKIDEKIKELSIFLEKNMNYFDVGLCHNDLLSSNIIKLKDVIEITPANLSHCNANNNNTSENKIKSEDNSKIAFIDFEYCDVNYKAFDIANHLVEYIGYNLDYKKMPNKEMINEFLKNYNQFENKSIKNNSNIINLESVLFFIPITHLFWGLWSLLRNGDDFDYYQYGINRIKRFSETFKFYDTVLSENK